MFLLFSPSWRVCHLFVCCVCVLHSSPVCPFTILVLTLRPNPESHLELSWSCYLALCLISAFCFACASGFGTRKNEVYCQFLCCLPRTCHLPTCSLPDRFYLLHFSVISLYPFLRVCNLVLRIAKLNKNKFCLFVWQTAGWLCFDFSQEL